MSRRRGRTPERINRYEGQGVEVFTPLPPINNLARIKQQKTGARLNFGGEVAPSTVKDAHIRTKTPEPRPSSSTLNRKENESVLNTYRKKLNENRANVYDQNTEPQQVETQDDETYIRRSNGRTPPPTTARRNTSNIDVCGARGRTPQPPASHMQPAIAKRRTPVTRCSPAPQLIPQTSARRGRPPGATSTTNANAGGRGRTPTATTTTARRGTTPTTTITRRGRTPPSPKSPVISQPNASPLAPIVSRKRSVQPSLSQTSSTETASTRRGRSPATRKKNNSPLAPPVSNTRRTPVRTESSTPAKRTRRNQQTEWDAEIRDLVYDHDIGKFPGTTTMIKKLYSNKWKNEFAVPAIFNERIIEDGFSISVAGSIMNEIISD